MISSFCILIMVKSSEFKRGSVRGGGGESVGGQCFVQAPERLGFQGFCKLIINFNLDITNISVVFPKIRHGGVTLD